MGRKWDKSFEQWCIENDKKDILDRWDYNLNIKMPSEIGFSTNIKYYFKCPHGLHESELKSINNFTRGQQGSMQCRACNSFAQWGINNLGKDFLDKYWDWEKNNKLNIDPWKISRTANNPKVWVKCQDKDYHGSYPVNCGHFTLDQTRCPYCFNRTGKVHILDSLGTLFPNVIEVWSNKNHKSPYQYAPQCNEYVYWKCPDGKHEDYYRSINNSFYAEFRCPKCVEERTNSFLQESLNYYLNDLGFPIFHERDCTIIPINPKTNCQLPFDNEIIINNKHLIIEVHGSQHYRITAFTISMAKKNNKTPEQELHYQKLKDRYKRIFAKQQGYFYLEIPYWTDNKEETWKKLIDNKIEQILEYNVA